MKKKKKRRVRRWFQRGIYWQTSSLFTTSIVDGKRELIVGVQPAGSRWGVVAVETAADVTSVRAAFADHGHEQVGVYRTVKAAFAAAEAYVRKWKKRRLKNCECGDIGIGGR